MSTDLAPYLHHAPTCPAWAPVPLSMSHANHEDQPCECGLLRTLARHGLRIEVLEKAANKALEPTGEHRVIDGGYCPDCQGQCLRTWLAR